MANERTHVTTPNDMTGTPATAPPPVQMIQLLYGSLVLVIDTVIPDGDTAHFGKLMDIVMLACFTGRERTEAEFAALFRAAGLKLNRVVATKSIFVVLEAVPE